MAFPTIPTAGASTLLTSNQAAATTTHTFPSLTNLPNTPGALLLAVIVTYNGGAANAQFSGWGGGFTEFVDQSANSTTIQSIGAANKLNATGSETGTFTVTTVSSTRSVMFLMEIPGAHTSTPPEAGAKADGTSAAANPLSLDPAGWAAEDTLWIAVGVNGETSLTGSFTGITAAPTNYTNYFDSGIIGGDVIGALEGAVAFRQLNASAEDAAGFTLDVGAAGNSALLIAVRPAAVSQFDQAGFIGRNDDGTLVTATQKAAENVGWSQLPDEVFRIRFVVDETAGVAQGTQQFYQLRYNRNGLGWNNVDAASAVARTANSAHVTNAEATARLLSSGTGTFHAGEFDSNNGLATGNTFAAGELTEVEYSLQLLGTDVTAGDLIDFRVERSVGGALETYTQVPTVTVAAGAATSLTPYRSPYRRILAG